MTRNWLCTGLSTEIVRYGGGDIDSAVLILKAAVPSQEISEALSGALGLLMHYVATLASLLVVFKKRPLRRTGSRRAACDKTLAQMSAESSIAPGC